jgi:predicted transcriptional regulator
MRTGYHERPRQEAPVHGFGELETAIMDRLWSRDEPATVRDVFNELRQRRQIAYTTVEPVGRAFRYTPVAGREQYVAQMMRRVLDDSGDRAEALTQFVGRMTLDEAAALRAALTAYERKIKGR